MAEQDANSSATATDQSSSTGQGETVGSESTQPAAGGQVDAGQAEDKGNSGSSDGADGSEGDDGERRRPSRAERRISELSEKLGGLEQENRKLRELLDNPLDKEQIQLPDRSNQTEITSEQYTQDVVSVADQIVKARLGQILDENNRVLTGRQQRDRAFSELKGAPKKYKELDPNSEQYDPMLETYLANTFEKAFKADPGYSFDELVEQTLAIRNSVAKTTNTKQGGSKQSTSQGALKPAASKPAHKPIENMSSDEYLAYLRSTQ